mmetsp:Transcript_4763/g.8437  ORF Transcript_4763/g.8437 Transcript_4763/m.8437 type:complete len:525 (-) Transcript_4763:18-1592(-)
MPWRLVPLHDASDEPAQLPAEGEATVGRRPTNHVVCRDLAVSGQHCILHCQRLEPPVVEDCSTNGSFVNDVKLLKGQRRQLAAGDVLSLSTVPPAEEAEKASAGLRIQYRLEFQECHMDEAADLPPTMPDARRPVGTDTARTDEKSTAVVDRFAQDLLLQEQESKAKLTADLLTSQRKLEEERRAVESRSRELRKVRQQVEEERSKRQEAEESRDRLTGELEALRSESRQLQELTSACNSLEAKQEVAEKDLFSRVQHCQDLDAEQAQLRKDLAGASEAQEKASQQLAELQIRARQAQERAERLDQQQAEAKREAEKVTEDSRRLEEELATVTAARKQLEDEVTKCQEQVSKAEDDERLVREQLDSATSRRAELEVQAATVQSDADSARWSSRQCQQHLLQSRKLAEGLKEAGQGLSAELRRRVDLWEKVLAQGLPAGQPVLEEAIGADASSTVVATCRVEDAPTKSQHGNSPQGALQAEGLEAEISSKAGLGTTGGCSTAWSLEVLDLEEPPAKKAKRGPEES